MKYPHYNRKVVIKGKTKDGDKVAYGRFPRGSNQPIMIYKEERAAEIWASSQEEIRRVPWNDYLAQELAFEIGGISGGGDYTALRDAGIIVAGRHIDQKKVAELGLRKPSTSGFAVFSALRSVGRS